MENYTLKQLKVLKKLPENIWDMIEGFVTPINNKHIGYMEIQENDGMLFVCFPDNGVSRVKAYDIQTLQWIFDIQ